MFLRYLVLILLFALDKTFFDEFLQNVNIYTSIFSMSVTVNLSNLVWPLPESDLAESVQCLSG